VDEIGKGWMWTLIVVGSLVIGLFVFRLGWVDFVDNYELGYKYDARTGQTERLGRTGYFVTSPFLVKVHSVDLRPMQVCINANARVLNCKLVQFNSEGLEVFISWHGRGDYNGDVSNPNQASSAGNLNQILMSYAFDGSRKTYPFLKVLRELKPEEAVSETR